MSIYIEKKKPLKKPRLAHALALLVLCLSGQISMVLATTDTWVANGDGTVTDVATGLIWQQQRQPGSTTHIGALTSCQDLTLAGNSNWRLPNIKELTSIVDYRSDFPAIDDTAFIFNFNANAFAFFYWSTSSDASNSSSAWAINFDIGDMISRSKFVANLVRCVR